MILDHKSPGSIPGGITKKNIIMEGIKYIENFIGNDLEMFNYVVLNTKWDESMKSRKTASYGASYNYSQITYPKIEFTSEIEMIKNSIVPFVGFCPNNCLINYYIDANSKMGYHSDQIDILDNLTGVVIVSLGDERVIRFRNIENKNNILDFKLKSGSLFYMDQEVQRKWQHSVIKGNGERISLTFRKIK